MFKNRRGLISAFVLMSNISLQAMVCGEFTEFDEFNGHYYSTTTTKIEFSKAKELAEANDGYLAIPNSQEENDFITKIIKNGKYSWIGVYDPQFTSNYCFEGGSCLSSDKRFRTIKNEVLTYKNFASSQPDNLIMKDDLCDFNSVTKKCTDGGDVSSSSNTIETYYDGISEEHSSFKEVDTVEQKFKAESFNKTTVKYGVSFGANDLDLYARGYDSSGELVYEIGYGGKDGWSVDGATHSGDVTSGGDETITIDLSKWKEAGVEAVHMYINAYTSNTNLDDYDAVCYYWDSYDIKRELDLKVEDKTTTLMKFNLEDNSIFDIDGSVVLPDVTVHQCLNENWKRVDDNSSEFKSGTCRYDYSYYTYSCDIEGSDEWDFEGPYDKGEDCDIDNLIDTDDNDIPDSCNSPTSPEDNCLKKVTNYDFIQSGKVQRVAPLGENWVAIAAPSGKWADEGNHFTKYNNPIKHFAVFEFDTQPECYEPPEDYTEPKIEGEICNTGVKDNSTDDDYTLGEKFQCQQDPSNLYYCPADLAPCAESWDYFPSTSEEKSGVIPCSDSYSSTTLNGSNCEGSSPCTKGTYNVSSEKCEVSETKLNCDGSWHGFASEGADDTDGIKMVNWKWGFENEETNTIETTTCLDTYGSICSPDGPTYPGYSCDCEASGIWTFKTQLKYKCSTSTSVTIEQYHGSWKDGIIQIGVWSALFRDIDISSAETDANYDSGLLSSPDESWADATYNVPVKSGTIYTTSFYMDKVKYRIYRDGTNLQVYAGNTYDGMSSTVRDEIYGTIPLSQTVSTDTNCPSWSTGVTNGKCSAPQKSYKYYDYLCQSGGSIVDSGGDCETSDLIDTDNDGTVDSCNSETPPENNCREKRYTCVAAANRPCVQVDNKMQCSPYPCFGEDDIEDMDVEVGQNDGNNEGWDDDGSCGGELLIFSGNAMECRSKDSSFGFLNFCRESSSVIKDYDPLELKLLKLREKNRCHYIGERCSNKVNLVVKKVCTQTKQTYCCFNSPLARIFNEQGRPQINKSWGTAEEPECKGFTPDEFQKLDFSKMDLSEYFDTLLDNFQLDFVSQKTDIIKTKMEDHLENFAKQPAPPTH